MVLKQNLEKAALKTEWNQLQKNREETRADDERGHTPQQDPSNDLSSMGSATTPKEVKPSIQEPLKPIFDQAAQLEDAPPEDDERSRENPYQKRSRQRQEKRENETDRDRDRGGRDL